MASRGRKQIPSALKLVRGETRPSRVSPDIAGTKNVADATPISPPKKLTKARQRLWDRYIATAWWLAEHDAPKAFMWCALEVEFEKSPEKMAAARIAQLRALGSELGFDPTSRQRMAPAGKNDTAKDDYF